MHGTGEEADTLSIFLSLFSMHVFASVAGYWRASVSPNTVGLVV